MSVEEKWEFSGERCSALVDFLGPCEEFCEIWKCPDEDITGPGNVRFIYSPSFANGRIAFRRAMNNCPDSETT